MERLIYVGDNVLKKNLKTNKIYIGKPYNLIERLKLEYPLIENLFVRVDKYNEAATAVQKQGTLLYEANKQLKKADE